MLQDGIVANGYSYGSRIEAASKAASFVKVSDDIVRHWVYDYEALNYISESKRGRHPKESSPIINDLEFREQFVAHFRETSRPQGKFLVAIAALYVTMSVCLPVGMSMDD